MSCDRGLVVALWQTSQISVVIILELPVESYSEDRHWTTVAIECRIINELIIHGRVNSLPNLKIVVGFRNLLTSVSQRTVPEMAFILNSARFHQPHRLINLLAGFFYNHTLKAMMGKLCRSRELRYMDKFAFTTKRLGPRQCG